MVRGVIKKPTNISKMPLKIIEIESRDFDEFCQRVEGFDVDFRPMGKSKPTSDSPIESDNISQSIAMRTHIGYMRCSIRLNQHVLAPQGMRTIAILPQKRPPLYWCGQPVMANQFLLFSADGEMASISNSGFEVITLSFPQEWIDEVCNQKHIYDGREKVLTSSSWKLSRHWQQLSIWLSHVFKDSSEVLCKEAAQHELVRQIVRSLFSDYNYTKVSVKHQQQMLMLNQALAVIKSKKSRFHLKQLHRQLGTTERTLERLFKLHLGMTPKEYLTGYLMSEVNHLLAYHGRNLTVSQAAWQFGFNHLGQFSSDYKRIVGEKPSSSLERQHTCHAPNCDFC